MDKTLYLEPGNLYPIPHCSNSIADIRKSSRLDIRIKYYDLSGTQNSAKMPLLPISNSNTHLIGNPLNIGIMFYAS